LAPGDTISMENFPILQVAICGNKDKYVIFYHLYKYYLMNNCQKVVDPKHLFDLAAPLGKLWKFQFSLICFYTNKLFELKEADGIFS
jgi:hypothetical protein